MDWIHLTWTLNVKEQNERQDEPFLQFALVTIIDGEVRVHPHDRGTLTQGAGFRWGSIRSGVNVPDVENPFFGVVIRAIERDNSGSDRNLDRERYFNGIRTFTQRIVDSGAVPTANQLLQAGAQFQLIDNFGDDDDFIGLNARAFPNIGLSKGYDEALWPYFYSVAYDDRRSGLSYSRSWRRFRNLPFRQNGADYELNGQVVLTPEEPIRSFPPYR